MKKKNIPGIAPLGRMPLSQRIYENLKRLILEGGISPGTKLTECQVAKQMDTSTTPVREAFRLLASEGFVKIEPWKGVVVQEYSTLEIQEVFQCRQILEALALDLTISRLENLPEQEEALRRIEEDIVLSAGEDTFSGFVERNSDIHDFWIKGSGNHRLIALIENLNDVLLHDRNISAMDPKRRFEIIEEHREILLAVRALDRERAQAALRRHIDNGYQYSLHIRKNERREHTSPET